jgi:hypothetical protein
MTRCPRGWSIWPLVLLATIALGCHSPAPPAGPSPQAIDRCATAPAAQAPDTLVLGLADPIRPADAPVPGNGSEQLVFSQLYTTLIGLDCTGEAMPRLASHWNRDAASRWTFHIRPARFSDGQPITAEAVLRSWLDSGRAPLVTLGIDTAEVLDDSTLRITPSVPDSVPPAALADLLAVGGERGASGWPAASGAYQRGADPTKLIPRLPHLPVVSLRHSATGDARDLLDQGADLVISSDPRTLAYVAGQPQFESLPLGWSRRYLLLTPGTSTAPAPDSAARQVLADAAVRVEARPATRVDSTPCPREVTAELTGSAELAVPAGDPTAALLAQRLIALANGSSAPGWLGALTASKQRVRLAVVPDAQLGRHRAAGYVVGMAVHQLCPTASLGNGAVVPLIETRARAVLRRGKARVSIDYSGGLTILSPMPEQ